MTITIDSYKENFKTFLHFCPYFARNLLDIKQMYQWFENLKLKNATKINHYADFWIRLEWYNLLGWIKPFCVVEFPKKHSFQYRHIMKVKSYSTSYIIMIGKKRSLRD